MLDLVVVSTTWCGPCNLMTRSGVYDAVEAAGYPVTKIDAEQQPALANQYGAHAVPTLVVRKDGVAVGKMVGARDARTLIAEIERFA